MIEAVAGVGFVQTTTNGLVHVYVTPHSGGSTDGTSRKRANVTAENLDRFACGDANADIAW